MGDEQIQNWRRSIEDRPIDSCGRLDMSTWLSDTLNAGRVQSDEVRYIYFKDGGECIVVGHGCDFVAFKAWDYATLATEITKLRAENEKLTPRKLDGPPTERGWYWWQPTIKQQLEIAWVEKTGLDREIKWRVLREDSLSWWINVDPPGDWYGPLAMPEPTTLDRPKMVIGEYTPLPEPPKEG